MDVGSIVGTGVAQSVRLLLAGIILSVNACAKAEEAGDRERGLAYAKDNCAECHAVDRDKFDSPNVNSPAFGEIANRPGMSQLALVAFFQTTHQDMPNFIVPTAETRDLIAYILSLKE